MHMTEGKHMDIEKHRHILARSRQEGGNEVDLPLWMLLIRLATVTYRLRTKLH
jgi:hypothetical protein